MSSLSESNIFSSIANYFRNPCVKKSSGAPKNTHVELPFTAKNSGATVAAEKNVKSSLAIKSNIPARMLSAASEKQAAAPTWMGFITDTSNFSRQLQKQNKIENEAIEKEASIAKKLSEIQGPGITFFNIIFPSSTKTVDKLNKQLKECIENTQSIQREKVIIFNHFTNKYCDLFDTPSHSATNSNPSNTHFIDGLKHTQEQIDDNPQKAVFQCETVQENLNTLRAMGVKCKPQLAAFLQEEQQRAYDALEKKNREIYPHFWLL